MALNKKTESVVVILFENNKKSQCCGCTACVSVCPQNCITMIADNEGFLYPQINKELCNKCGRCAKVCPVITPIVEKEVLQSGYLFQHRDQKVRDESTAGGAFTAIAEYVIALGGVVFGVAYDEHFQVYHTFVETVSGLAQFRNSKYVQSVVGNSFTLVKEFLDAERLVCFSGTPCQIEGLFAYLEKDYSNLILVDIVCRGIPSPLIWQKYLEHQSIDKKQVDQIRFRDKHYGYKCPTLCLNKYGKTLYRAGSQADPMLRAFMSNKSIRPSCYACPAKKRYRVSDMTIWDCFSVYNFDKKMDDDKGTTRVLCHTTKGSRIMNEISETSVCLKVSPELLIVGVTELTESVDIPSDRDLFFIDARQLSGHELFSKYYPITASVLFKTVVRHVLLLTGMYKLSKRIHNKMKGR